MLPAGGSLFPLVESLLWFLVPLPWYMAPARRNFQRRSLIFLSATRFFTAFINFLMRYGVKVAGYVALYYPLVTVCAIAGESVSNKGDRVIGASFWPESI